MAVYNKKCIEFDKKNHGRLSVTIKTELKKHEAKGGDCYGWSKFEDWMTRNELGKRPITTAELKNVLEEIRQAQ